MSFTDIGKNIYLMIKSAKATLVRLLKCMAVAVIGYWVDYGLLLLLLYGVFNISEISDSGELWNATLISQSVSYVAGVLVNFFLNKYWSFGIKRKTFAGYFIKFIVVTALAYLAKIYCIYILSSDPSVGGYGVSTELSALAASLFTFIINYSGNVLWVFNPKYIKDEKYFENN